MVRFDDAKLFRPRQQFSSRPATASRFSGMTRFPASVLVLCPSNRQSPSNRSTSFRRRPFSSQPRIVVFSARTAAHLTIVQSGREGSLQQQRLFFRA